MSNQITKLAFAGKLEVKFAEPGVDASENAFSGYGAVFNNTDYVSDIIAPGAFATTLEEHRTNGTSVKMFFNHDAYGLPIGVWDDLEEDQYGLKVSGRFIDTAAGRDAYAAVKAGAVSGLSIGYYAIEFTIENGIRTITEAKLVEISVVTFPCNSLALVSDVKSAPDHVTDEDFLAKLAELGVDDEDAKALLAKRTKSDDDLSTETTEEKLDDDVDADEDDENEDEEVKYDQADVTNTKEDKYLQAAFEAVSNLIRELKQENHGRF